MTKILSSIALIALIFSLFPTNTATASTTGYFIVTAYYSPLPNQANYATGNYYSEKILNGEGHNGASGRAVFSGMLAAPGKYSFGTKIQLEGLGIGSVEDRGGAIVAAGKRGYEHDRIDVWMGYGDEGLRRAMNWGKRKVKGTVIAKSSTPSINIDNIPAPTWITKYIKRASGTSSSSQVVTSTPNVFNKSIGTQSSTSDIKDLQNFLKSIGKYNGEIDGIYNKELMNFVYDFQIENDLVQDWSHVYAGYWGKSVRDILGRQYLAGDFTETQEEVAQEMSYEEKLEELFENSLNTIEETKFLQEILTEMNIYTGEINGVYSDIRDSILDYQLDNGVILKASDTGGGYFGPKTRASLKKVYEQWRQEKKVQEKQKIELQAKKEEIKGEFNTLIEVSEKEAQEVISAIGDPKFGEIGTHIRELQNTLSELGYFEYKDTAIFGVKTQNAIIGYQIEKNLIQTASDIGAGNLGPKTKNELENDIKEYILKENLKSSGLLDTIESLEIKKETPDEVSTESQLKINLI